MSTLWAVDPRRRIPSGVLDSPAMLRFYAVAWRRSAALGKISVPKPDPLCCQLAGFQPFKARQDMRADLRLDWLPGGALLAKCAAR